ncbi:2-amino-4-hydroxy-6-hydroxymethyldihydropteridine diphosphokinase [Pelomicrobium methylotrophicum]|uniref:2-amino-4-hydroxy-6-hydroxymethyldihydropteridine pyrophosphokinase n=1 Tax=Pelomicrobium methylotrophicum TaxID=2602750 RepID=A0A5C7EGR8_9PROT|nr:2-amino-4-hydroxy-6-hydroxymethyldihydropteridine diphosphokinase [Pelomicrobium methylotrophicum]TXF11457.1 2-amino-4-hydroxy-6-hydroxymethyldihydropteridine diphosphokinase [Pelomicrobium methylotrophicum]
MTRAFIALGSNLQRPERQVLAAIRELDQMPGVTVVKRSSLYRTQPVGYVDQPEFINAVVEVETSLRPRELLAALLSLERLHGRQRTFPNAPRTLDLDLLMYEGVVIEEPGLTLPHPRMHERAFVLVPLAEIAPEVEIPGHGRVRELATSMPGQGITRLTPAETVP